MMSNAQQAVVEVEAQLFRDHPEVVDAGLYRLLGDACQAGGADPTAARRLDRQQRQANLLRQDRQQ
jgi:RNA-directed DNA polymerase